MKRKPYQLAKAITPTTTSKRKVRKHHNAGSLFAAIRRNFQQIHDSRGANCTISLDDALISGLAVFQLKYSSLLAVDKQRKNRKTYTPYSA